jgi:hypothetical protein
MHESWAGRFLFKHFPGSEDSKRHITQRDKTTQALMRFEENKKADFCNGAFR